MKILTKCIAAVAFVMAITTNTQAQNRSGYGGNGGLGLGTVGLTAEDAIGIGPTEYLTTWNFNNLPARERAKVYRESTLASGQLLREYWFVAEDRDIEIAPGVWFPAWTYNGQVPGPTIRATEGDRIRVHFLNNGTRPHTIHFHGYHPEEMDGSEPSQFVFPGETFVYEFDAAPFGIHLYHCHATPLTQHIHKGLYGVFIIDPPGGRPPAQEVVMMMNGFDTNFDEDNEVYAVNSIAFYYQHNPIQVRLGEKVRIYLVNVLEFDETNSFHVHANFFEEFRTGTSLTPNAFTDTVIFGQAERSILEIDFQFPGRYMFHAHKTEFAELGWMGLFDVRE
jgi:FtsP/CotA-like multicopper oxidase with cupredoxin domain